LKSLYVIAICDDQVSA